MSPASGSSPHAAQQGAPSIPDYELVRLVGRGSYGDVWLARGLTGIWRAIKIVWRERFEDALPFEREFKGLKEFAQISLGESSHLALLHVGRNEAAGFFYYVMELADDIERGREVDPATYVPLTLAELRRRRERVPPDECVRIGLELARVLAAMHRRGLVHRDIKPSNVILVEGAAKLADIGLVAPATSARTFVGTEGYVPPEGPGSPSADVFALGKVLYELATGFDRQEFPQLPPDLNRIPDHRALLKLNEVILRACDPLVTRRYRDATEMGADLTALHAGKSVRRRWMGTATMGVAATVFSVLVIAGASGWWRGNATADARPQTPTALAAAKSIAVLPFANRSNREEDAFFSDGMHDDLLTHVSRIKDLKTISRTSVMGYRGTTKNLRQIAAELGVATILEGGVQRSGNQVRINVQLVDAHTDTHLWAQTYDKQLTAENVFAIQSEITSAIAAALRAVLSPEEKRQLEEPPTLNLAALEAFFKAKTNDGSSANIAAAISYLQRSLELDPGFAEAHASIANQYLRQVWSDGLDVAEQVAKAKPHVERALALAPRSSAGFVALGVLRHRQGDVEGAVAALRQAIAFNANNAEAFGFLGYVELWGRRDSRAAVDSYRRALALDPLSSLLRQQWVEALLIAGPFDEALTQSDRLLAADPDNVEGLRNYGQLQEFVAFRYEEAIKAYRRTVALDPRNPNFARRLAGAYLSLGDNAAAKFWFERALAVAPHSREVGFLKGMLKLIEGDRAAALDLFRAVPDGTAGYGLALDFRLRAALEGDPAEALAQFPTLAPAGPVTQGNIKDQCFLAYLLIAAGKSEQGETLAKRILAVLPEVPRIGLRGYFDRDVLVHLARGDRARALAALRKLSDTGACSIEFGVGAPFRVLRDDPEFQTLLQLNATRLAEQRGNLARWEAAGTLAPIPPLPDKLR